MTNEPDNVDEELEELLANQKAEIKVFGVGGAGGNTLNRLNEVGVAGAETIALNTDAQDLLNTNCDKKILIGKDLTKGLGAGSDPQVGEESARENERDIKEELEDVDMVFITAGMGGGTGTGAAPVVADLAQKAGALTVGVVTTPFTMEGARRIGNAEIGLDNMQKHVDTLIVIPNDKLLELAPDLPLHSAFKVADEILTNAVKGITELVTKSGLVNTDFADIKTVMDDGGLALIGTGESDSENRADESVEKALANPLLDVDIDGAKGALINVIGGPDMTLEEARSVVEKVSERLDEDAQVIWGARVDESNEGTMELMVVVTGVSSNQITQPDPDSDRKDVEEELGIEFVE
jgi:cell division protein FtsZ